MSRFISLALIIPLSTLTVACSNSETANQAKEQTIAGDTSQDSKQAEESSPIITEDNFPQAYTF